jgi:hypothetical protein
MNDREEFRARFEQANKYRADGDEANKCLRGLPSNQEERADRSSRLLQLGRSIPHSFYSHAIALCLIKRRLKPSK